MTDAERSASQLTRTIASEGRKFGLGLMMISQRPSRLDETALSQCNSYIIRRLVNPADQWICFQRTMAVNKAYQHDGYVPVIHISQFLEEYCAAVQACDRLSTKPAIALGGIVPNLLRALKAMPYTRILEALKHVRKTYAEKKIHVFGIGGTATMHLAALLKMDSVDSSGWRNRAARGIVQLPGCGDRTVAELGNWRGRKPTSDSP